MNNLYKILDVPSDANKAMIINGYWNAQLVNSFNRNEIEKKACLEKIREAFATLKDTEARTEYDRTLMVSPEVPSSSPVPSPYTALSNDSAIPAEMPSAAPLAMPPKSPTPPPAEPVTADQAKILPTMQDKVINEVDHPLYLAVLNNDLATVRQLRENSKQMNCSSIFENVLTLAADKGNTEIIQELLMFGYEWNADSVMDHLIRSGNFEVVKFLCYHLPSVKLGGLTLIEIVIEKFQIEEIQNLVQKMKFNPLTILPKATARDAQIKLCKALGRRGSAQLLELFGKIKLVRAGFNIGALQYQIFSAALETKQAGTSIPDEDIKFWFFFLQQNLRIDIDELLKLEKEFCAKGIRYAALFECLLQKGSFNDVLKKIFENGLEKLNEKELDTLSNFVQLYPQSSFSLLLPETTPTPNNTPTPDVQRPIQQLSTSSSLTPKTTPSPVNTRPPEVKRPIQQRSTSSTQKQPISFKIGSFTLPKELNDLFLNDDVTIVEEYGRSRNHFSHNDDTHNLEEFNKINPYHRINLNALLVLACNEKKNQIRRKILDTYPPLLCLSLQPYGMTGTLLSLAVRNDDIGLVMDCMERGLDLNYFVHNQLSIEDHPLYLAYRNKYPHLIKKLAQCTYKKWENSEIFDKILAIATAEGDQHKIRALLEFVHKMK